MINLHFSKPGLQTLVVDQGRTGYQSWGIPVGGAVDQSSASLANWLVGNPLTSPVLEITLMGPSIEIQGEGQIAITGADLSPKINEQEIPIFETINVTSGMKLSFGAPKKGCRAYIAVRGLWQLKPWFSSYSALACDSTGITKSSVIKKNSTLSIDAQSNISPKRIAKNQRPGYSNLLTVSVLPGPEFDSFSKDVLQQFLKQSFKLSPQSNRMGCRLNPELEISAGSEMISSGVIPGTIQITSSGQPIILLADAQTTGGYPRIANVISTDIDALGQMKPGDEVNFELVDLSDAQIAIAEKQKAFNFLS
ncbi:MAG: biotin-dependent carboxyltransferase family protein [Pseudomonadota bacterium]